MFIWPIGAQSGRVDGDQPVADFAAGRLSPRVSVRSPHAVRLGALVDAERRAAGSPVEVVRESGNRIAVYGSTCAAIGETAFRNGILIHQLADEVVDAGPSTARDRADGRRSCGGGAQERTTGSGSGRKPTGQAGQDQRPRLSAADTGPSIAPRAPSGPAWPLRYELIRATGVRSGWLLGALSMGISLVATGLGLSISANIVEQHGGSILVENRAPGCRFTVTLPVESPPSVAPE